jgi:hypothetical protein
MFHEKRCHLYRRLTESAVPCVDQLLACLRARGNDQALFDTRSVRFRYKSYIATAFIIDRALPQIREILPADCVLRVLKLGVDALLDKRLLATELLATIKNLV